MPRRGARRGTRPLRWSVDLSPAEFAYVEAARAVYHAGRAAFVVGLASDLERRLTVAPPVLAQARVILDAENQLLEEEDDTLGRDRIGRGGRRPVPRLLGLDEVAKVHATIRRQPQSAERLTEMLAAEAEDADG